MQHIPTAISVAALIVAFVAVSLMRRAPELPKDKEKKARKKAAGKGGSAAAGVMPGAAPGGPFDWHRVNPAPRRPFPSRNP
jgi:hypothetical protein